MRLITARLYNESEKRSVRSDYHTPRHAEVRRQYIKSVGHRAVAELMADPLRFEGLTRWGVAELMAGSQVLA